MKIFKKIFLLLLFLSAFLLETKAQFIDIDWETMALDTLLPRYTTMVELPDDYIMYDYSAVVEYPEFVAMSNSEVAHYRLEMLRDSLPAYPVVSASVGIAAKRGQLDISFVPIVCADGRFMRINSFKLVVNRTLNITSAVKRLNTRAVSQQRYAQTSVLDSGRWVRIAVKESGVHKITTAELKRMGFKNPDRVRLFGYGGRPLPEENIHQLSDDLKEIPLWRENGYVLFYANGTVAWKYASGRFTHRQNVYSREACYFLNESDAEPAQFPKKQLSATISNTYDTYPDYELYEKEEKTLCTYGRILLDSYDYTSGRSVNYRFNIDGVVEGSRASVDLSFGSNATSSNRVSVEVNGTQIGSLGISQASSTDHGRISNVSLATQQGFTQNTTIKLTQTVTDAAVSGYLDYLRLNFVRNLAMRGSDIEFRGDRSSGNATFKIANATSDTHVWLVTDQAATTELSGEFSSGTLSVVAPASYNEQLVAVNVKGSFPSVTKVEEVANQNLHALGNVDMVIIVPSNGMYTSAANRLAEAHKLHSALNVAVVTAQQVYNEFSSGTPDATAYRRLMKMLYDRADDESSAPKYLLLFGDGLTDNRLITYPRMKADNFLLTYQSENSVSAVRSYVLEDYFAILDDSEGGNFLRDKVDIAVGRIPVQTAADAAAVVDKLVAYIENRNAGAWQNVVLLMGDDGDVSIPNQHMKDAEAVATNIAKSNPAFMLSRIYWDDYPMEVLATGNSYPVATQAIYDRLDEGALIVNYSGHGSANLLSHEQTWKASDMAALTSPRVPFWVTASCDIGPFDMGDGSLAETALLNPNGAAIGLLTTTRTVLQSYNAIINQRFMRILLTSDAKGDYPTVGEAMRKAKCEIITDGSDLSENKLQYVIIGDPALHLNVPRYRVVVDKFGDDRVDAVGKVQAGGKAVVEGYVARPDGTVADDFTGVIQPTLFDCIENVETRDNTGLGKFSYVAYRNRLFSGSDSIIEGRFKLTIPVPMDISYRDEQGMLNLFAIDSSGVSAQGYYNNFTVGGTASSMGNDGKGPQITMYLNTPEFVDGDEVNATPCLFVELFDEDGINTVGTGIGHDIMAVVDNDKFHTYNLNSAYVQAVGDYRKGTIEFPLSQLDEGEHTLLLRAWDLFNNSSTDTLTFVVVPSLAPDFIGVTVSPNPVNYGQQALFVLSHNRPHSELDVTIELFNLQGQMMWHHSERMSSANSQCVVQWDVTAQGGRPMPTGVYVYRARLASQEGVAQTKTEKIIVLNNK